MKPIFQLVKNKLNILGPGILMASAAVGGSHLIASTQAGAMYGWQLAIIILLACLFKYPFFYFGYKYTLNNDKSLLEGYYQKNKFYLWAFLALNILATVVNVAALLLLSATILKFILPIPDTIAIAPGIEFQSVSVLCLIILGISLYLILAGKYIALDNISKIIMVSLTLATLTAVILAFMQNIQPSETFVERSPWNQTGFLFMVVLIGWMPAPIEISAITSLWVKAKQQIYPISLKDGIFDFNVGYIGTAILAVIFLALGALIQYPTGVEIKAQSGQYINQLINMYSSVIGNWSQLLVGFIAFLCIYGSTITVIDGYSRSNAESLRIIAKQPQFTQRLFQILACLAAIGSLILIFFFFKSAFEPMIKFAMILSFLTTPFFAWLNLSISRNNQQPRVILIIAWMGLLVLSIFTICYIYSLSL